MIYLFLLCCICLAVLVAWSLWVGARSREWPRVRGTVVAVKAADFSNSRKRRMVTIIYRYTVGGKEHYGMRIGMDMLKVYPAAEAGRIVARYPQEAQVDVFYSRLMPSVAVLEPGVRQAGVHLAFLVFTLLLGGYIAAMLYTGDRFFLFRLLHPLFGG